ncbi:MAG TPA: right-handed parallel beta-helix repeat-containing protein [Phycisphaerales bacterium]|nr:right-handed parallel beta-helix repeat-containing protein [Phycisphaerales bacterium]
MSARAGAQPTAAQFKLWLAYYSQGDLRADYNYDGVLTPLDFSAFLQNYDNPPGQTSGWTQLSPSSDSRVYYVSSSQGNDSWSGLSASRPLRTIAAAYDKLRDGKPDWIKLRSGDYFFEALPSWKKSGRSKAEPMVLTNYGSSFRRPRIYTGSTRAMRATGAKPVEHLCFVGLEFTPHERTRNDSPGGIQFIGPHKDILIEDCQIRGYSDNLLFQGDENGRGSDFRVRRSQILDSWAVTQHSQGIYASQIDGLLLEENIFDHNGWKEGIAGAEPTIFNHNIYVQVGVTGLNVRGNIISNASSHGIQARSGGQIIGNLFYRNAISLLLGQEGAPVTGTIAENVILAGKDIAPDLRRGMGIHLQNLSSATIRDNLILRNETDTGLSEAIAFIGDGRNQIRNVVIERNTIYNWLNNVMIENENIRNITFRNNVVYDSQNERPAVRHRFSSTLDDITATGNTYKITGTNRWFRVQNTYYTLNQWLNVAEESNPVGFGNRHFFDDNRTMTRYAQTLLLPPNPTYVINAARGQNRDIWDEAYSGPKMVDFFRQGYKLVN